MLLLHFITLVLKVIKNIEGGIKRKENGGFCVIMCNNLFRPQSKNLISLKKRPRFFYYTNFHDLCNNLIKWLK